MNIRAYGTDKRLEFCKEYLEGQDIPAVKGIALLPVPSTKDGITIHGTCLNLKETVESLDEGWSVIGYGIGRDIRKAASSKGVTVVDVSRDEEYLVDNAILTALGTVGRILTEESTAPAGLKIGVIGYGRIGARLVHILMYLGASVVVFTSKSNLRSDICMLGVRGVDSLSLVSDEKREILSELDILINTAPCELIGKESAEILKGTRLIELASGNNFPEGMYYERFASVPQEMYPRSAGQALAKAIIRMLGGG